MPRWVFMLGVGLGSVTFAFLLTDWLVGKYPGPLERNAERIRAGMLASAVRSILGREEDTWCPIDNGFRVTGWEACWIGDRESVKIEFGTLGTVISVETRRDRRTSPFNLVRGRVSGEQPR